MGVKGKYFLDAVWDKAAKKGCLCESDIDFAQDVLGSVRCERCKSVILTQIEVDEMERKGMLPVPHISADKLSNWFADKK